MATLDILVPEEYIATMQQLYQKAPESSFEDVKLMIESSTGKKIEDMFSYFNEKPISSASIAQVHEATSKNGEKLAVKVQHSWLKEQCDGDIRLVALGVEIGERLFPEFKYRWFADEIKINIPKELDFYQEAKNAERISKIFMDNPSIKVPKVYPDMSTVMPII